LENGHTGEGQILADVIWVKNIMMKGNRGGICTKGTQEIGEIMENKKLRGRIKAYWVCEEQISTYRGIKKKA
jgi:hypothetical protein